MSKKLLRRPTVNWKSHTLRILLLTLGLGLIVAACKDSEGNKKNIQGIVEGPLADGCPGVTYPDWQTSPYVLPYPVGKAYEINLSTCGGSYHSQGRPDEFAIDFDMAIGTLITACRPGTVVHVVESGFDGNHPNNLVVVDHGDNTYAEYMHLTHDGALVNVGDKVKQGDDIGLSGSTGLAGYPHLHFVVAEGSWQWPYESTPVTFSNTMSNVRSLASGTKYEAYPY